MLAWTICNYTASQSSLRNSLWNGLPRHSAADCLWPTCKETNSWPINTILHSNASSIRKWIRNIKNIKFKFAEHLYILMSTSVIKSKVVHLQWKFCRYSNQVLAQLPKKGDLFIYFYLYYYYYYYYLYSITKKDNKLMC